MENKTILKAVVGSQAYGMATPTSDTDYLGVYVVPTDTILGLKPYAETMSHTTGTDKEADPDTTMHEVGKFLKLVLQGNPTVTELLWLEEYIESTLEGRFLRDHRASFLSEKIRATYGGYARQQFKRLQERGDFSSTLRNRTEKHARHMMRLVIQGREALSTGRLRVLLTPLEVAACRNFGKLAVKDPAEFQIEAEELLADFDQTPSVLPPAPNMDMAHDALLFIRKLNYG